jgi:hypothetical protein
MSNPIPETKFTQRIALSSQCDNAAHSRCGYPDRCTCKCHEIPETDLVKTAEREVIEKAKEWGEYVRRDAPFINNLEENLFASVTLLTAREAMRATLHLDDERGQL